MTHGPDDLDETRREALSKRLHWLDASRAAHRRSQRRAPLAMLAGLLAIPAAIFWGAAIGFYVVLVAVSLMSLVFYVAWNHEQECAAEQDAIRVMLAGGPAAVAAAEDAASGNSSLPGNPLDARTGAERERQRAMHARNRRPRPISL